MVETVPIELAFDRAVNHTLRLHGGWLASLRIELLLHQCALVHDIRERPWELLIALRLLHKAWTACKSLGLVRVEGRCPRRDIGWADLLRVVRRVVLLRWRMVHIVLAEAVRHILWPILVLVLRMIHVVVAIEVGSPLLIV